MINIKELIKYIREHYAGVTSYTIDLLENIIIYIDTVYVEEDKIKILVELLPEMTEKEIEKFYEEENEEICY